MSLRLKILKKPWTASEVDQRIVDKRSRGWIYGCALIAWIASCYLWKWYGAHTYYMGTAQFIFVATLVIHLTKNVVHPFLSSIVLFVAANNAIDELFFAPWEFNVSEPLIAIAAAAYYFKKYVMLTK